MPAGWHFSLQTVLSAIAAAATACSLAFIPLVLVRRKDPPTAVAWILVLLFLPVVGVVLFWFLGRNRVRRPVIRKASSRTELWDRHAESLGASVDWEHDIGRQPIEQQGVMRLAARLQNSRLSFGNQVEVLVGAEQTYDAQLQCIEQASRHIHMEYYIFRNDRYGRRFLEALARAVQRGVRVRVLVDAFGSRALRGPEVTSLVRVGAELRTFFPFRPFAQAWSVNLRNHRKLMVVDGHVAFTGGVNIGEMFVPWRDVHLRMQGPAVREIQNTFVEDWYFATGHDLTFEVRELDSSALANPMGESIVQMVNSGPDATVEAIHRLYFAAIASARDRVYVTTPYFVPDRAMLVALQTAALRGVDVRLLLPSRSNHRVTFHAGRSFYDELLEAGVRIHEYLPGMVHTKTMVVDGRFATVGSANLDVRSFRLNFESIVVLYDAQSVGRLERLFLEDLGHTQVVELDVWRVRPWGVRVVEGYGRLCSPLL
jgi:cardiolipin synthase